MRRLTFLFVCIFVTLSAFSQRTITMEKEGGVYKVPCTVNGARMKMIFDTGASSISISLSIANFLYENDYIVKEDILGKGKSQTASGDIVDHIIINLRDVEIAGIHLKNIEATVIEGQDVPLLFGQTAIQALGAITIRGDKLIINDAPKQGLTSSEINNFRKEIESYLKFNSFFAAIDCLIKIKESGNMTTQDFDDLSYCYYKTGLYEECIDNCKEMLAIEKLDSEKNYGYISNAYYYLGESHYALRNYEQAILYYEKDMARTAKERRDFNIRSFLTHAALAYGNIGNKSKCLDYFNYLYMNDSQKGISMNYNLEESTKTTCIKFKGQQFIKDLAEDYEQIGLACVSKFIDRNPSDAFIVALRLQCDYLGYDYDKVINKRTHGKNTELGHILYLRGLYADNADEAYYYIRIAMSWGDKEAADFINGYETQKMRQLMREPKEHND